MNTGNVPKHLEVSARTGFLHSVAQNADLAPFNRFTMDMPLSAASQYLVDLGGAPRPTREKDVKIEDFVERSLLATPINWVTVVWISYNADKDDQTNTLSQKVQAAGEEFVAHKNDLAFQTLNGGDGNTYGLTYNGLTFFNDAHIDKGARYQTGQDNKYALALSPTNFNTVWANARLLKNDQGKYVNKNYNLIVTDPTTHDAAFQIANNVEKAGTAERDRNPWAGNVDFITDPNMDTGAWVLMAADMTQKPLILVEREAPNLQHLWFDPMAPDGGRYYFKFYARYNILYGDWRLAVMGNS